MSAAMDPFFGPARVDADEWRDAPRRHRYAHGAFEGTDTRFSLYLPEASVYDGRFMQFLQGGMGGSEHIAVGFGGMDVAFGNGGYLVESNQGHIGNDLSGLRGEQTVLAFRASAQSARFARDLAADMYGRAPHHGYVFGGSGGAMRSISCLEAAADVYDGAVPFMVNHGTLFNYNWSVMAAAEPVLREKLGLIADATDAGGSGDPFAVLDTGAQRDALTMLYRAGFPRGGEHLIGQIPLWVLSMQVLQRADPSYFEDFWRVRGYAGADGDAVPTSIQARVVKVVDAGDVPGFGVPSDDINLNSLSRGGAERVAGVVLDLAGTARSAGWVGRSGDPASLLGSRMRFKSGRELWCTGAVGDVNVAVLDPVGFQGVQPGDVVEVDDRDFLAFVHFHRHLVSDRYPTMRQFVVDGSPLYPQRDVPIDDRRALGTGRFRGKMILLQHAHDRECWPSCGDVYARLVGEDSDDRFRLWWVENASHFVPIARAGRTRLVNYGGYYARAVRDVVAWVEDGTEPLPSTPYELTADGRLLVRGAGGIQPQITLTPRVETTPGEAVRLEATVSGDVTHAEWDLDGSGRFATPGLSTEARFDRPGTHMVTLRVSDEEPGDGAPNLRRRSNLARTRVVVR